MAWGLDDLVDWLEEAINGAQVVAGNRPATNIPGVNQNVNTAIVNPANIGLEVSGAKDFARGIQPGASGGQQALGLLALAGMVGGMGAADDIGRVATKGGKAAKLKGLDVFGKKVDMLHASPTSGIKKFSPSTMAESIVGKQGKGYTYFLPTDKAVGNLPQYMAPGHRLSGAGKVTGSIYKAKVPAHRLEEYILPGMTRPHPYGRRVSIPIKVAEEKRFVNQGVGDVNDVLRKWLNIQD